MRRLKIYLDTSVISHLNAPDTPDKMNDTQEFWKAIQKNKYDVYISPIVMIELDGCSEPKRSSLLKYLSKIEFVELKETDEVLELAERYLAAGILPIKSNRDRQHIAYACVYDCDMIASWNFKHLVNYKTISGVKSVNAMEGYREMPIYSPTMLIEGGREDDT